LLLNRKRKKREEAWRREEASPSTNPKFFSKPYPTPNKLLVIKYLDLVIC
jgi:hypothetical protein